MTSRGAFDTRELARVFVGLKSSVNLVFMEPSSPHEMFMLLGENNKILDALMFNPDLLSDANFSMQYSPNKRRHDCEGVLTYLL